MSKFSDEVRSHFLDLLNKDGIEDVEIHISRFPSSIFSIPFWKAFTKKLVSENDIHFTFYIPVNIDKTFFEKIESKINLFTEGKWDKTRVSYQLMPWLDEESTSTVFYTMTVETTSGAKTTYSVSKEVE